MEANMQSNPLHQVFLKELRDIYNAENQLVKALPKMAKAANSEQLRNAFTEHLEQTHGHADRLETIFQNLDENPKGAKCKGMEGLIEEGEETLDEDFEGPAMDAAIIGAAQRVEHYEIAAYGTATEMARLMGHEEAVALLEETLEEEKETDKKLTELAATINREAMEGHEAAEEETETEEGEVETVGTRQSSYFGGRQASGSRQGHSRSGQKSRRAGNGRRR